MNQRWLIIISIICVILSIIPFGIYFYSFHGDQSSKIDDWAHFGDFIGGILGPVLALVNLIVFLYLTYAIHMFERSAKKRDLLYQKKLINSNQKYETLREISQAVNKMQFVLLSETTGRGERISELLQICDSNCSDIKLLFPEISLPTENLDAITKIALDLISEVNHLEKEKQRIGNRCYKLAREIRDHAVPILKSIQSSINKDVVTED